MFFKSTMNYVRTTQTPMLKYYKNKYINISCYIIYMNYTKSYTLNERRAEALRVKQKYSDRLPIICDKHHTCNKLNNIDRIKFLVPKDLTIGQFMFVIRRRLKLQQDVAIYFIINGFIPKTSELIKTLYEDNMNEDYFLYIHYTSENVFG